MCMHSEFDALIVFGSAATAVFPITCTSTARFELAVGSARCSSHSGDHWWLSSDWSGAWVASVTLASVTSPSTVTARHHWDCCGCARLDGQPGSHCSHSHAHSHAAAGTQWTWLVRLHDRAGGGSGGSSGQSAAASRARTVQRACGRIRQRAEQAAVRPVCS
jgi:hypothetical protein